MMAEKTIPGKLFDSAIRDQVNMDRYAAGLDKKIQILLANAQAEIVGAVAKFDPTEPNMTKWKLERLTRLNREIDSILSSHYGEIKNTVSSELKKVALTHSAGVAESFNNAIGADIFGVTLDSKGVKAIVENTMIDGNRIGQWWDKQKDDVKTKMAASMAAGTQAIQIGLIKGESVGDLINRIRGTKTSPGIMSVTKWEATSLVRTSVMQVANATRLETYKANADVLDGIEVVATLDDRTTEMCMALDGKRFDLEGNPIGHTIEYPGGPPFHWNCRSTIVPITKSWAALIGPKSPLTKEQIKSLDNSVPIGMRSALNGPIPANKTYNDWLLDQSEEMQKDILGPGKWSLWKDNKLSVSDLVDNRANPLTLKQLREKIAASVLQKEAETTKILEQAKEAERLVKQAEKEAAQIAEQKAKEEFEKMTVLYPPVTAMAGAISRMEALSWIEKKTLLETHIAQFKTLPPATPALVRPPIQQIIEKAPWDTISEKAKDKEWTQLFKEMGMLSDRKSARIAVHKDPNVVLTPAQRTQALTTIAKTYSNIIDQFPQIETLMQRTEKRRLKSFNVTFGGNVAPIKNTTATSNVGGVYFGTLKRLDVSGGHGWQVREFNLGTSAHNIDYGAEGIFRHELGHHVQNILGSAARANFDAIFKALPPDIIRTQISRYAATNSAELFAESFCAWTSPYYTKSIKKLPAVVEKFMVRYFKRGGSGK
jgi:SPP1 gp7 family putative phage head morphogenesis protein